jgi:hypothetical protein
VFFDTYTIDGQSNNGGAKGNGHADEDFLVAPCPTGIQDKGAGNGH